MRLFFCDDDKLILIMPKAKSSVEIKNRRASFDYEFIETFQAGIVLTGKKASLSEQCKEIEGNNRMGKTRALSKKLEILREHFRQR